MNWNDITDYIGGPDGPPALLLVLWLVWSFLAARGAIPLGPVNAAIGLTLATEVAARHSGFTVSEQYGIIVGTFWGSLIWSWRSARNGSENSCYHASG
jgi:hypothetical protein